MRTALLTLPLAFLFTVAPAHADDTRTRESGKVDRFPQTGPQRVEPDPLDPLRTPRPSGNMLPGSTGLPYADPSLMSDEELMNKLHELNLRMIDIGHAAGANTTERDIRLFGDQLVDEHAKADQELADLARKLHAVLRLPEPKNDADRADQKRSMTETDRLKSLSGNAFDKEFLLAMERRHARAIAMLTACESQIVDGDLAALVRQLRPAIIERRKVVVELNARLNRASSS